MIKHLSVAHRVTVASLVRSGAEAEAGKGIAPYCAAYEMGGVGAGIQTLRMIARLPTRVPSSMGFFYSPVLARSVRALLRSQTFNLIFVHCSSVAQYVEDVRGVRKILDFGDMDSQKWLEYAKYKPLPLSLGYSFEGSKLLSAEKRLACKFDICTTTTRREWETLEGYGAAVDTDWFPNGVDSEYFTPATEPYEANTISFVGRLDYFPNQQGILEFCGHVLPALRARRPEIQVLIVGADPPSAIRKLGNLPGVKVVGTGTRRAPLFAPLRIDGGAVAHCARNAE